MQFSRGPYYSEEPLASEPREEPRTNRTSGVSKAFAFSLVGIAVLLGFTLGLISDSFGDTVRSRASLYDEAVVTDLFESRYVLGRVWLLKPVRSVAFDHVGESDGVHRREPPVDFDQ